MEKPGEMLTCGWIGVWKQSIHLRFLFYSCSLGLLFPGNVNVLFPLAGPGLEVPSPRMKGAAACWRGLGDIVPTY